MLNTIRDNLSDLIGVENSMGELNRRLRRAVSNCRPAAVGALRITCADESERECIDSFQKYFVDPLLPRMKFWNKSPFRLANLGGRYEEGSLQIAESHFALPPSSGSFKILLTKVNSHVSVVPSANGYQYGTMDRYQQKSRFCGAMQALLEGVDRPFARELEDTFRSGSLDRLTSIKTLSKTYSRYRLLLAAVVNARLQIDRALQDLSTFLPLTPTIFLLVACVTLNKKDRDGELMCGFHYADYRNETPVLEYTGLSDDPASCQVDHDYGVLRVTQP